MSYSMNTQPLCILGQGPEQSALLAAMLRRHALERVAIGLVDAASILREIGGCGEERGYVLAAARGLVEKAGGK